MPSVSKSTLLAGAALSILWLAVNCLLASRFNMASGDSILYALPLAVAKNPFDLGVPFLSDFDGFGTSWGHQWPGAMWLRGFVFWIIPYQRIADVAVLLLFQWGVAMAVMGIVWKATRKTWAALAAAILILSDRLMLLACAGNRFETIAVFCVVMLLADSHGPEPRGRAWRWSLGFLAFLCPTTHPYALALGGLILAFNLTGSLLWQKSRLRESVCKCVCFIAGIAAAAAWFVYQPAAMRQFTNNLALQHSFFTNWNSVFQQLSNYRFGGGWLLWVAALAAGGWLLRKPLPPSVRLLTPLLFAGVIAMQTITRCENFHYLVFGTPSAVIMVCVAAARIADGPSLVPRAAAAAFILLLLGLHATILPYRIIQFARAGFPDLGKDVSQVLEDLPADRAVYIPHVFWPAAVHDSKHAIRWWTLPIASPRETRQSYEKTTFAKARPGDYLIVDNGTAGTIDKFGLLPTYPLLPPDPARWTLFRNEKKLFSGSVPWGLDVSIYEFRTP